MSESNEAYPPHESGTDRKEPEPPSRDYERAKSRWKQRTIWLALGLACAVNAGGELYHQRELSELNREQAEIRRQLPPHGASSIDSGSVQNALGQVESFSDIARMQGEDLQKIDYYEQSVKTQCSRVLPIAYDTLKRLDANDPRAQALKRSIATLEELVGKWFEDDRTDKTRAQRLYEALDKAKSAFEVIIAICQVAKAGTDSGFDFDDRGPLAC